MANLKKSKQIYVFKHMNEPKTAAFWAKEFS